MVCAYSGFAVRCAASRRVAQTVAARAAGGQLAIILDNRNRLTHERKTTEYHGFSSAASYAHQGDSRFSSRNREAEPKPLSDADSAPWAWRHWWASWRGSGPSCSTLPPALSNTTRWASIAGYYPEPRPGGEAAMSWLPVPAHPFFPWLLLVMPTIGGLISGVIVFTFAPEAEGHGTDSVIAAYHYHQGQIRPRVPLVKIVASSITLGTGGSGGREGPIAQIGAGFGSLLGNLLRLRPAERRVLMAAGMGAGIGAIFAPRWPERSSPRKCCTVPRSSSRKSSFRPGIASVISYCVYGMFSGWEPLFTIPPISRSPILCGWDRTCSWPCSWPCWRHSTREPSMAASICLTGCPSASIFDRRSAPS